MMQDLVQNRPFVENIVQSRDFPRVIYRFKAVSVSISIYFTTSTSQRHITVCPLRERYGIDITHDTLFVSLAHEHHEKR